MHKREETTGEEAKGSDMRLNAAWASFSVEIRVFFNLFPSFISIIMLVSEQNCMPSNLYFSYA